MVGFFASFAWLAKFRAWSFLHPQCASHLCFPLYPEVGSYIFRTFASFFCLKNKLKIICFVVNKKHKAGCFFWRTSCNFLVERLNCNTVLCNRYSGGCLVSLRGADYEAMKLEIGSLVVLHILALDLPTSRQLIVGSGETTSHILCAVHDMQWPPLLGLHRPPPSSG